LNPWLSVGQLTGPFTPTVCEWAFSTWPTSLAHVQALLFRVIVISLMRLSLV
jgi:hypothetical protein